MRQSVARLAAGIGCLALLAGRGAAAAPARLRFDPAASTVDFLLNTTWHDVHGHTTAVTGAVTSESGDLFADGRVTVAIDAKTLVTGIAMRDRKMHDECLETGVHPTIGFVSTAAPAIVASTQDPGGGYRTVSLNVPGDLTIHGVKRAVKLPATARRDGAGWIITGELKVKLSDYAIPDPSILFNRVQDQVTVTFTVRAMEEALAPRD
jgi:polyisoprenoid-binding protein YceI